MKKVKYLIVGSGITGLSFASKADNYLLIEKEDKAGGLCKTIRRNGYVWDYSGHFFHFKESRLKRDFVDIMNPRELIIKNKCTKIYRKNLFIDFPFQKNIHELDKVDFINCLYDLYFRQEKNKYENFEEMLYGKFGKSITEMFLKPYNEKLYACKLNILDADAMGRFFPYADFKEIIFNMRQKDKTSYNETFLYPRNGAEVFINLLMEKIEQDKIWFNCELIDIDMNNHMAITSKGCVLYEYLINTIPLNLLCNLLKISYNNILSANKVLVFNIGFDKKSQYTDIHWMYFPEKKYNFYRVGFYDNILEQNRLSIYVEIGFNEKDVINIEKELEKTISGLRKCGIVSDHRIVDYSTVVMNPAYVHINKESEEFKRYLFKELNRKGIYSIGRYGKWTYCSIEDCILDAINTIKQIRCYE
ncbi:MAG: NAD(P)-binding protein [Dorea sp.]|nr:NAD(P)-binding protein [Dorea sp.]